jgi:hypothetical protein
VGYNEIPKAYHLYDSPTHKVIEQKDVVFDEILTHIPLGYFPLLSNDGLRRISVGLISPHFDDDSPFMSVSSRQNFYNDKDIWIVDSDNITNSIEDSLLL